MCATAGMAHSYKVLPAHDAQTVRATETKKPAQGGLFQRLEPISRARP